MIEVSYVQRTIEIPPVPPLVPLVLAPMCVSNTDTRSLDFYRSLFLVNDSISSVMSITATRLDGLPLTSYDLLITPPNTQSPWVSPNAAGVANMAVNWWQSVGTLQQISVDGCNVTYLLVVTVTTAMGRTITVTASQLISPVIG